MLNTLRNLEKSALSAITALCLLFCSVSCSKNESGKTASSFGSLPLESSQGFYDDYEFIDPEDFFTLDYRPEKPEEKSAGGKANLENPEAAKEKSASFVPGLRKLSEYKTEYQTKRLSIEEYLSYRNSMKSEAEKELEKNNENLISGKSQSSKASQDGAYDSESLFRDSETSPFKVKDWGPKGTVPSSLKNPQFYIEFNYPVISLSALQDEKTIQKNAAETMQISPKIPGKYTWNGTRNLSFEADEPLKFGTEYRITVSDKTKSPGGQKLSGERIFRTKAENPDIAKLVPGEKDENTRYRYFEKAGLPLEQAKYSKIYFTGFLTQKDAEERLEVFLTDTDKGKAVPLSFTVSPDLSEKTDAVFTSDRKRTNAFYIVLTSPLEKNCLIEFSLDNKEGGKTAVKSFRTERPFVLERSSENSNRWSSSRTWNFVFNHNIDKDSVMDSVSLDGADFTEDNFDVYGSSLVIRNLKIEPDKIARLKINTNLKNIYGANLERGTEMTIQGRDYSGYAKFIDSGTKMLESRFPHKIIFEYMNVSEDSAYKISKPQDPLETPSWNSYWSRHEKGGKTFANGELNTRQFEEIDLEPYLTDGKGFVRFEADIGTLRYEDGIGNYDNEEKNFMTLQVTDLGATVRFGMNKAVVMVRTLSTDEPVEGAKVYLKSYDDAKNGLSMNPVCTDKDGIAVIEADKKYQRFFTKHSDDWETAFIIEKDSDKIYFKPQGHYYWKAGIGTNGISDAYKEKQRTFMFTDRGIYRPGETVTFRGIDRDQKMGSFIAYEGNYSATLEKNSWRDTGVYGTLDGQTSASGGFWGKFVIPEDAEPGSYMIKYRRSGTDSYESLYFDVAFFEKLKIQGSVKTQEKEIYAGDTIGAKLEASYLAGGFLAGEEYSASWYTEPARFSPEDAKLKDYSFSISSYFGDDYEGRRHIKNEKGVLSSKGEAELSCSTEGNLKGTPYLYRVEASVKDASNQEISVRDSKMVHPSLFYTGIGKADGVNGFAKKGQKLEFPFILVTPDEKILEDRSLVSGNLSYTFTRHYWTYDYQNSVNDSVYQRYTEHTAIEAKGEAKPSKDGKISFTPKNSGYYTLRISSFDREGREAVSERNFYVTGSGASAFFNDDSTDIKLTPDQNIYNPGDTAEILLESPLPEGDYLICVEREGIFTNEVRHFSENTSVIEVPVARNYVPVCYVTVSSYSARKGEPSHEYGEKDLGKPKGYFGVAQIFVNPRVRAFSIQAEFDKPVYRPGDTATVTLKASKGGKAVEGAELTVMGVDRAVLDIIDHHVPDPIEYFYSAYNFPLCVKGGDSRSYLIDPVTYSIKNLQGGDSDEEKDEDERKDFRPTAFFEPSVITDKDGTAKVSFKVPDSLTTYRMTAFGVHGELLALQEDEFAVQNPINAQQVQPRKVRERDTAECGVLLTNISGETQEAEISVQIRTPKNNSEEDETSGLSTKAGKAFIDGEDTHTVKIASGGSSVVYFDIAAEKEGDVELLYTIKSGILSERLASRLTIEKTYTTETVSLAGATEYLENGTKTAAEGVVIPSFAEDGNGSLSVTLDATRLGLLGSSVNYLFSYPYGCLEQQISKMLPLVIFENYINVFNMDSEISNVRKCVKSYFKTWKNEQNEDGGFPYWPGTSASSDRYVSLRMAHIYALAKERGYKEKDFPIDIEKLQRFIENSTEDSKEKENSSGITYLDAYSVYALSLLGNRNLNYLLPELEEKTRNQHSAAAATALAYLNLGETEDAKRIASRIRTFMRPSLRSVDITDSIGSDDIFWWDTKTGEKALILKLFANLAPEDEMTDRLVFSLLSECSSGYWESTATTAKVLDSIHDVIKSRKLDATNLEASAKLGGILFAEGRFKGSGAKPLSVRKDFLEFSDGEFSGLKKDSLIPLQFSASGSGTLYYSADLTYSLPNEIQNTRNQGFAVSYKIFDCDTGKEISLDENEMVFALESGRTYRMKAEISSTKDAYQVAFRIPVPSGAEILNPAFETSGTKAEFSVKSGGRESLCSNISVYDNEMQLFWNRFSKGEKTVEFTFRAVRRGVYPVPPAAAECMYSKDYFGRSDGYIFTVK